MEIEYPDLDYELFGREFELLMVATGNKLEREWPEQLAAHEGLPATLLALIRVSANTYRGIAYICSDAKEDLSKRLEYSLAMTPLARTLLDALYTAVYLLEEPMNRPANFYKGGWREMYEERDRYQTRYGHDPRFLPYLEATDRQLDQMDEMVDLHPDERTGAAKIARWPTPVRMVQQINDPDRKNFLEYMNDWFMRELSQDTHLSWPGLIRRYKPLSIKEHEQRRKVLGQYKSNVVGISLILMMALMSEIELAVRYGLAERLKYVWGILNPHIMYAREVYDLRYAARL